MLKQKFKPNREILKIKDISVDMQGLTQEQKTSKEEAVSSTPVVYYYNTMLPPQTIKRLTISSVGFLPTISMVYLDSMNIMHDIGFPGDNATITVVLPANHKQLANIYMEFKIQTYEVELKRGEFRQLILTGVCNVDKMLISEYKSFQDNTSYQVMAQMAQEGGLGFQSNVESSNDKMNWINPGLKNYAFLEDTANKSWVGEAGFIWSFVDLYYNLNYIDVERALSQDINEIKWLQSFFSQGQMATDEPPENDGVILPQLTNGHAVTGSNTHFTGEKIINNATKISLDRGYIRYVHYYDIDGKWDDRSGSYKKYALDTITTPGTENISIYLKGEAGSTDFYNSNTSQHYVGRLDTKNMYADFLWASMQNQENMQDIQKITMQIIIPVPNFNIKRFEKVLLKFVNNTPTVQGNLKNAKLNGEWLVTGYYMEYNGSAMWQVVNLIKRELTFEDL